ncbi:bromodomain-containing protein [Phanerochaete sordida]|uniref:Bromodomain-containing protein n=1 Tax=Phanerochaete sordida TaxID=48140 RepID=A0A9P3G9F9_9APHY|nr:bromodomain-containing protein [Phanerochaete sordida]
MEDIDFASNDVLQPGSSHNGGTRTGLRLVLPPLSAVKALKNKKKSAKGVAFQEAAAPKIPRPVKLKPLREVLTKLIVQIKKKDDYAFFLEPVDPAQVPGYADVIKNPMDFGTVTAKVHRGKYRSLEEFANDVRLITTNAKTFNPPGTIYHSEAERIETYAIDHINRAAASVIEYETDWNIDVERDEDPLETPIIDDDDRGTPMDVDDSVRGRSPSVASQVPGPRRGVKPKKESGLLAESLEPDGHLPGYKDGVGQFPPGSEWADLMLSLKLKGKKYRTKKERMRAEKSGPPLAADGSVDYTQTEDPFSVLSVLLPDPPAKPLLTSLYPSSDPYFPSPTTLPSNRPPPQPPLHTVDKSGTKARRRHWNIVRNAPARRARDREGEGEEDLPSWKVPHEPHSTDFGAFATLTGTVAQEYRVQNVGTDLGSEAQLFGALRHSIDRGLAWRHPSWANDDLDLTEQGYWARRARAAEDYVRDVVYGGVDGLAYVRSLAEFVQRPAEADPASEPPTYEALGMPLARYVEESVIDPLTGGRHRLIRQASRVLHDPHARIDETTAAAVERALHTLPQLARHLVELRKIHMHPLDMAALIQDANELFKADDEWAGKAYIEARRKEREEELKRAEAERERELGESAEGTNAMQYLALAVKSHEQAQAATTAPPETPEMLQHALDVSADLIVQLAHQDTANGDVKTENDEGNGEDPVLRKLRLNLLSLAKRAPLDKISRLPSDMVPEAIRHIVPTIEPSPTAS